MSRPTKASDPLVECLSSSHQLEAFLHEFIGRVAKRRPKSGEDVTKYADDLRLTIPDVLKSARITWVGQEASEAPKEAGADKTLILARSGHADALGFTIGCITIRGVKICLECGWLYCRIVIKGRF